MHVACSCNISPRLCTADRHLDGWSRWGRPGWPTFFWVVIIVYELLERLGSVAVGVVRNCMQVGPIIVNERMQADGLRHRAFASGATAFASCEVEVLTWKAHVEEACRTHKSHDIGFHRAVPGVMPAHPFAMLGAADDVQVLQPISPFPQRCEGHKANVNGLVDQMPFVRSEHPRDASTNIKAADKRVTSGAFHGAPSSARPGEGGRWSYSAVTEPAGCNDPMSFKGCNCCRW